MIAGHNHQKSKTAPPAYRDRGLKALLRAGYRSALTGHALISSVLPRPNDGPRLYYAGARPGSAGGPKVKVARLSERYPEHLLAFNLVYLLSNTGYLSARALSALKARAPLVLNQNGVFYPAWYGGDWRRENARMSLAHKAAGHVFYQSDFCRRAAEKFLEPATGTSEILYNAIDTNLFCPALSKPDGGPFRFLVAGKIGAHQGYRVRLVLDALARLRREGAEAELTIAGVVDNRLRKDQPGVTWAGPFDQQSAPTLYRSADAFVTLTHQDACPSAVIEAMSCGLPVIYPTSGGVPELVGLAGVAIETGEDWEQPKLPSLDAVCQAMVLAMEQREALSPLARQRAVDRFDLSTWFERHENLFAQVLAERRGAA